MSDINKEIDELSTDLAKSQKTPKEVLFDTIRELGPAGIRAKLPTLEKSEQELLIGALQEMSKAVAMDADYQAKYVQGKITDTKIQEDKADDDQDEKLVKPEAATISHQGTPTPGWEGQVIKGKEPMKEMKNIADKEAKKEVGEHEDKMHMAKKKVKSGDKDKMKEGLKEMKKALEDQMGAAATPELVKGAMKKLLAEESQDGDAPEMNEATRAKKESVPAIELGKDNKKNMTKSADWSQENALLKAMTGGRNHHFSMEEYIDAVLKNDGKDQTIEKSNPGFKPSDLNEIIAKGEDASWDQINCDKLVKANVEKQRGKFFKSFQDDEIAQALGLSPEEAKKILGEK